MAEDSWKDLVDLDWIEKHYEELLSKHGPGYLAAGWPTLADQQVRFQQFLKLLERPPVNFSLLDYGCGIGVFDGILYERGWRTYEYVGYDLCKAVTIFALEHRRSSWAKFTSNLDGLAPFDYVVSSGIFNLPPPDTPPVAWRQYIVHTIQEFDRLSTKGFAFNMLSSLAYNQESGWFYGNPEAFFEICFRMTGKVALLHDYGLNDFTIIVRK